MDSLRVPGIAGIWLNLSTRSDKPASGCDSSCPGRPLTLGVALALLLSLAMVLIAPSVDLPETVLREHHVASHPLASHTTGGATVTGNDHPDQVHLAFSEVPTRAISSLQIRTYDKLSVVLRC